MSDAPKRPRADDWAFWLEEFQPGTPYLAVQIAESMEAYAAALRSELSETKKEVTDMETRALAAETEVAAMRKGQGVTVKPLPRSDGSGGWTLSMDLLSDLDREVQTEGWDGCTAEGTEIIALAVESRILSALTPAPVSVGEAAKVRDEALREFLETLRKYPNGTHIGKLVEELQASFALAGEGDG